MQPLPEDSPLHLAADLVEDGILITDGLRVTYANAALHRMLGYSPVASLHGAPLQRVVQDASWQVAVTRASAARAKPWQPIRMLHKSAGTTLLRMHLVRHAASGCWVAMLRTADAGRHQQGSDERLLADLEAQQKAIANDLHDALGSDLAAIALMLVQIQDQIAPAHPLHSRIVQVRERIHTTAQNTRRVSRGMQAVRDAPGALVHALEQLVVDWQEFRGLHCELQVEGDFDGVPAAVGTHLYRITQEAINNALQHGGATAVLIRLSEVPGQQLHELTIEDNGRGLQAAASADNLEGGSGIRSARARARLIHGTIGYDNGPLGGCRVTVRWPRPPGDPAGA